METTSTRPARTTTPDIHEGRPRRRTLRRIAGFLLVTLAVWLLVMIGLAVTAHLYGQTDQAQPADVIVVLGSGLRRDGSPGDALYRRSRWAAQLWQQGLAPTVICTGGQAERQWRSEADACREVLVSLGVDPSAVVLEDRSRSTEENAIYAGEIMQRSGWQDAVLVTDAFHMLRANWIFNSYEITHYPSPVPANWVRRHWYAQLLSREVIALQWQVVKEALNLPVTHVAIG